MQNMHMRQVFLGKCRRSMFDNIFNCQACEYVQDHHLFGKYPRYPALCTFVPVLQPLTPVYENRNKKKAGAERLPALLVS